MFTYSGFIVPVCPCVFNHTSFCDVASGVCSCKNGWTGSDCATDIDECESFPVCDMYPNTGCQNREWGYDCLCLVGYQLMNDTCISMFTFMYFLFYYLMILSCQ